MSMHSFDDDSDNTIHRVQSRPDRAVLSRVNTAKYSEPVRPWRTQTIGFESVLHNDYPGQGTEESPYLVDWLDDDKENPLNFKEWYKWALVAFAAISTLAVAYTSSAYSGGLSVLVEEWGVSEEVVILGVSLFVLGFAIGPLFFAPLSEVYGRRIIFVVTYTLLTAFNAGAAGAPNIQSLIILRFFAGTFGSSPLTNSGGTIADLFTARQRGIAMPMFAAAPFLGPVLGPIVGGFIGETIGFRWNEGVMAIFTGIITIVGFFFLPETYAPVLLHNRAQKLSKSTGFVYRSKFEKDGHVKLSKVLPVALSRPWKLLFKEPIVLLLSIYQAILYGSLYMLFAAYPIVFQQQRGWSPGIGGLPFLGIAVGMICAVIYSFPDNKRYNRVTNNGTRHIPETRLPPAIVGSILVPIGLFWFAWTCQPSVHWASSCVAGVPFGWGMVLLFLSTMNYLIDAYLIYAASVLAASAVLRSLFGAAFPLFTTYMYRSLGVNWASSIPAFLALVCVPFPVLFWKYGARIRTKGPYSGEMTKMIAQMQAKKEASGEKNVAESASSSSEQEEPQPDAGDIRQGQDASNKV